jgi:adenylate cyclase
VAVPTEPGLVFHELPLLQVRALVAQAHGDAVLYRKFFERYRAAARSVGFQGHMAWANAMP